MAHRRNVVIAFGMAVLGQAVSAFTPIIERAIIDDGIVAQTTPVWPFLVVLLAAGVFSFWAAYVRRWVGGRVSLDVQYDLRVAIFERLQRLDFGTHDELQTGQLVSRASSDLGLIQGLLAFLPIIVGNLVMLVLSVIVMLFLSPPLTLVMLLAIPLLLFVSVRMRGAIFPATWDAQQRAGEVAGVVDEAVTGVRVVKGFGQEQRELDHLADAAGGLYASRSRLVRLQARYSPALQAIPAYGQVGVLAARRLARAERRDLARHLPRVLHLPHPARRAGADVRRAVRDRPAGARRWRAHPRHPRRQHPRGRGARRRSSCPSSAATSASSGVRFGYTRSAPVLDGFDLHVAPGEVIALVGASGSGKSTVTGLLPRFYDVADGRVTIDGVDVRTVTLDSLRRQVGVVFEDAFLFSDTVHANIAYGAPDATDAAVRAAADAAGRDPLHRRAPRRLRHRRRRARPHALGRPAPAHRARPGHPQRPARPAARRRHVGGRRRHRGGDPRHPARAHGRPHDDPDRAPPVHAAARAAHRADRAGPRRRPRDPRGAARPQRALPPAAHRPRARGRPGLARPLVRPRGRDRPPSGRRRARRRRRHPGRLAAAGRGAGRDRGRRRDRPVRTGWRRRGGRRRAWPSALAATPELLAKLETLPPADDTPQVDAAAVARREPTGRFRILEYIRPWRNWLLFGLALVALDSALTLLGPLLVGRGLDSGVKADDITVVWVSSAIFFVAVSLDWVVTWAYTWITGRTAERALYGLRIKIFAHLERMSLDYYDRELDGRIMTRMTTDVEALSQLIQTGLVTAVVAAITSVGVFVFLVILSPELALAAAAVLPPLFCATWLYRKRSSVAYRNAREAIGTVNANLQENLSGVRVAQAYVREGRNVRHFRTVNEQYLRHRLGAQKLISLYFPFVLLLADVGAVLVLGAGSVLVPRGVVTSGVVIAFLLYLDMFFSPIQQLSQTLDTWQQAGASLEKIEELLDTPSGTPAPVDPVVPGRLHGVVRFDDVRFAYPQDGRRARARRREHHRRGRRDRGARRRDRRRASRRS